LPDFPDFTFRQTRITGNRMTLEFPIFIVYPIILQGKTIQ